MTHIKPEKIRIAILLESLDLGGIGRLSISLAEELANRGLEVDLVLFKKQGEYLDQVPDIVNLVDLGNKRLLLGIYAVGNYLKASKPEVLISAKERVNIQALFAKRLYNSKTRIFISVHVNNTEEMARQGASIYRRVIIALARLTYQWADQVIAVSKGVAEDVKHLFKVPVDKIKVIYNPIISPVLSEKAKEAVEHSWFEDASKPVIVGMGRLIAQKDFSTLLKSFAQVRKEIPGVKLVIFGEGKDRSKLESEIRTLQLENDVEMPGYVDNPYKYLKRASVFVMSSAWEGFGNVLVEAMAVGTPVVSTDCPSGPAEILKDGKCGPLVPVSNVNRLAQAVVAVLKDPPDPIALQSRAESFSIEKAVDKYLELINS